MYRGRKTFSLWERTIKLPLHLHIHQYIYKKNVIFKINCNKIFPSLCNGFIFITFCFDKTQWDKPVNFCSDSEINFLYRIALSILDNITLLPTFHQIFMQNSLVYACSSPEFTQRYLIFSHKLESTFLTYNKLQCTSAILGDS